MKKNIQTISLFEIISLLNNRPNCSRFITMKGLDTVESLSAEASANLSTHRKCFTYVTKTIANLTTYRRKPRNYNGTIIFEIDIMKNLSPLNLKFKYFATVKTKITLFFCWTHSTLSSASE